MAFNRLTDRCDSCKAQAFVRVVNENDQDLLFCGHHFNKFEDQLILQGFAVTDDERTEVNVRPSISANAE